VGKARAKVYGRQGSFIRRRARSSLRRRKRISAPGQPPSVHSKDPVATLKNIWFSLDPRTETVVVGPLALNAKMLADGAATPTRGTVPSTLEFGGTVGFKEQQLSGGKWIRQG